MKLSSCWYVSLSSVLNVYKSFKSTDVTCMFTSHMCTHIHASAPGLQTSHAHAWGAALLQTSRQVYAIRFKHQETSLMLPDKFWDVQHASPQTHCI